MKLSIDQKKTYSRANSQLFIKSGRRCYSICSLFYCMKFIIIILPLFIIYSSFCKTSLATEYPLTKETISFKTSLNNYNIPYVMLKAKQIGNDEPTATLAAVGDIRITRHQTVRNIRDSILNIEKNSIVNMLSSKDIVTGNLEMAFMKKQNSCTAYDSTGEPEWAAILSDLQFSTLNLANNHFQFDAGACGIETSLELLNKANLSSVGMGKNFLVVTRHGVKIGMLGYARYTMNNDKLPEKYKIGELFAETIFEDVKRYKALVDHLVIFVHWGEALMEIPNPEEEDLAKKLLAAGAAVIIGTGPHVLQKVDIYENGVIAYSLGNYIFDEFMLYPQANAAAKTSCILEIEFSKSSIESVNLIPIITQSGSVSIPTLNEVSGIENHLKRLYRFTESDFYNRYQLWNRISDRLKMLWEDALQDPVWAFKNNIKASYLQRAFFILWQKYKYLLLVIACFVFISGLLSIKLRRRKV